MTVEVKGILWGACQLLFLNLTMAVGTNCPRLAVEELTNLFVLLDPRKPNC